MLFIADKVKKALEQAGLTSQDMSQLEALTLADNTVIHSITLNQKSYQIFQGKNQRFYFAYKPLGAGNVGAIHQAILLNPTESEDCKYVLKVMQKSDWSAVDEFRRATWDLEKVAVAVIFPGQNENAQTDSARYIVMPFIEGPDFEHVIPDGPTDFLNSLQDIIKALDELHRNDMSHGDLKSIHIIVNGAKTKLLDFGHAAMVGTKAPKLGLDGLTMPILYMQIPGALNTAMSGVVASLADDIYVLGMLIRKKMNRHSVLNKNKFLDELCATMTSINPSARPTTSQIIEKIQNHQKKIAAAAEQNNPEKNIWFAYYVMLKIYHGASIEIPSLGLHINSIDMKITPLATQAKMLNNYMKKNKSESAVDSQAPNFQAR